MLENGKERFIFTKSYEIAYSIFRIAAPMAEKDFSERLRASAGALLQAASAKQHEEARSALQTIECFVKFAGDMNLLNPANADTLLREIYVLDAAVIERMNAATKDKIDVTEFFSESFFEDAAPAPSAAPVAAPAIPSISAAAAEPVAESKPARERTVPEARFAGSSAPENVPAAMKAEARQSAILDRIRQFGNCRLKDIQDVLPECSERTIRYDLQSLLEKNLVERLGNGGPSVSYRLR